MSSDRTIYFKGLNGIRTIAALLVVVWHVDQFSFLFGVDSKGFNTNGMASRAVDLFFVLSGFLITYLLLTEKDRFNKIDYKSFYKRRILRIWPVYYLALLIALLFVLSGLLEVEFSLLQSFLLYVFLLANVAFSVGLDIKPITPLWSVGVEEQFYAIWPFLIDKIKNKQALFLAIFIGGALFRIAMYYVFLDENSSFIHFLYHFKINIMALGALGAYWYYHKNVKIISLIYRYEVQIISWLVLIGSIAFKPLHVRSYIDSEIHAVFYLILILNVATNTKSLVKLENKILNFLGRISYGIYVYHILIIYFLSFVINKFNVLKFNYLGLQLMVLFVTIAVAFVSYNYFESFFLHKKEKYSKVKSTN